MGMMFTALEQDATVASVPDVSLPFPTTGRTDGVAVE
jgi:hypothetical protein